MKNRVNVPGKTMRTPIQVAILMLLASAAQAQTSPAAVSPAQAADSNAIPEVVVTATKRNTSLQKTPVAVTAISAKDLDNAHVQNVLDIVSLVPGFSATQEGDHGVITMTMRGIGNDQAKTEYADPEVATFVDGVYSPRAEGATTLMYDLDGVEVLRGPQGTLWGRNSTVGVVNYQTAKPVIGDNSGNVEANYGTYNTLGAKGAINIPLNDESALRIAFDHQQHDGYVNFQQAPAIPLASQQAAVAALNAANLAAGKPQVPFVAINPNDFVTAGPKYDAQDQTALRVGYLYQPSAAIKWVSSIEKFIDHGTPNISLMEDPRAGQPLWSVLAQQAPSVDRSSLTVRSRVDWAVNEHMSLNDTFGYGNFHGASTFDQNAGAVLPTSYTTGGGLQFDNTDNSHYVNFSNELQLQSTGKNELDWLVGLYYARENNSIRFDIDQQNGTTQGTIGWQGVFIQPQEISTSKAVFTQETWNVNDATHLTGGLRFTRDDKANNGGNDFASNSLLTEPVQPSTNINSNYNMGYPIGQAASGIVSYNNNQGTFSDQKLTWLAKASFDLSPTSLLYVSASTGYKSGGLQDGGASLGPAGMFAPETIMNYELGTKNTFLGGSVKWNNAIYDEAFKGYQIASAVQLPNGTQSLAIYNVKDTTSIVGFESELAAKLTPNDRLQIVASYIPTAKLGTLLAGSNDYSQIMIHGGAGGGVNGESITGNRMPHAPKFSTTVQYEHALHLDQGTLTPRVSLHYETSSWLSVFNGGANTSVAAGDNANNTAGNAGDQQKAYTRTDLAMRYAANKGWYLEAYVRNVENANVRTMAMAQQSTGGNVVWQAQYMAPMTAGLIFGSRF